MNDQKKDDTVLPIPDWLREASKAAGQTFPTTCYLCGEHASVVGVFVPTGEAAIEFNCVAPEGKTRSIVYALCRTCLSTPGIQEVIEERFLSDQRLNGTGLRIV
jgi:hypothetical protein